VEDFINSEWLLDREDDGGARYIPPSMRRLDVAALLLTVPQFRAAPNVTQIWRRRIRVYRRRAPQASSNTLEPRFARLGSKCELAGRAALGAKRTLMRVFISSRMRTFVS